VAPPGVRSDAFKFYAFCFWNKLPKAHPGKVVKFDPGRGKHRVHYDDDDKNWEDLDGRTPHRVKWKLRDADDVQMAGPSKLYECEECGEKLSMDCFSEKMQRGDYGKKGILRCLHCTQSQLSGRNAYMNKYDATAKARVAHDPRGEAEVEWGDAEEDPPSRGKRGFGRQ
jgi:hypothetical protein